VKSQRFKNSQNFLREKKRRRSRNKRRRRAGNSLTGMNF
jgi:hypothetical protein